jgi:hypothetical protein
MPDEVLRFAITAAVNPLNGGVDRRHGGWPDAVSGWT